MENSIRLIKPSVEDAINHLVSYAVPELEADVISVASARGRILAEDIISPMSVPPHDNAALDGYAFRWADLPPSRCLPISGRVAAGRPLASRLPWKTAVRIFTGAPMPEGSDTVAMQEDCSAEDGMVRLPERIKAGENRRLAGEDVAEGARAVSKGRRLRPQDLGLAAAVGRTKILVYRPLRVAICSTGDEVRDPGTPLAPGCIYDANRYTTAGLLNACGAEVSDLGILPDNLATTREALANAASNHDLIVTSGGMSTGDEDHVKGAVQSIGSIHFWRIALKPGRPVAMGDINGTPFVGLPGNPVSAMVTFILIVRPLLMRMMGASDVMPRRFQVTSIFNFRRKSGRREFLRGRLETIDGKLAVRSYPTNSSGILSSMSWSDGLIDVPANCEEISPGDVLDFIPYSEVM